MNKNDFGLMLEQWDSFLEKEMSESDASFDLFIESCIEIEKEIDSIRESLILKNRSLKEVYNLNEAGLVDNFKKLLSGFKFRKDSGEKINADDPESMNKQKLTKASKAILILFITLKCSQAFAPTAHIDTSEFKGEVSIEHELTDSDFQQIKNMPGAKIKDLAKSLPEGEQKVVKSEVKKIVAEKIKKELKKIKANKSKAEKLKSKKAKEKAKKKVAAAAKEAAKKIEEVTEQVKETGLMDDPDVKEVVDLVKNSLHGDSGENEVNIDSSTHTLKLKKYFNKMSNEIKKANVSKDMTKINKLKDKRQNLTGDDVEERMEKISDTLMKASPDDISRIINNAKIHAFQKALKDPSFKNNVKDYKEFFKTIEKTINDKDSSDFTSGGEGSEESAFLAWLLDASESTQAEQVLHSDYDAPGDDAFNKLINDLDKNATEIGIDVESNPYYGEFIKVFEDSCDALSKGYKPSNQRLDFKAMSDDITRIVKSDQIKATSVK